MNIKPIPNWRSGLRMLTVQFSIAVAVWNLLDAKGQSALLAAIGVPPENIPAALAAIFIVLRMIHQSSVREGAGDEPAK